MYGIGQECVHDQECGFWIAYQRVLNVFYFILLFSVNHAPQLREYVYGTCTVSTSIRRREYENSHYCRYKYSDSAPTACLNKLAPSSIN